MFGCVQLIWPCSRSWVDKFLLMIQCEAKLSGYYFTLTPSLDCLTLEDLILIIDKIGRDRLDWVCWGLRLCIGNRLLEMMHFSHFDTLLSFNFRLNMIFYHPQPGLIRAFTIPSPVKSLLARTANEWDIDVGDIRDVQQAVSL